jgi:hypothetical protein
VERLRDVIKYISRPPEWNLNQQLATETSGFRTSDSEAVVIQLGDQELASGDWREGEVLFPL